MFRIAIIDDEIEQLSMDNVLFKKECLMADMPNDQGTYVKSHGSIIATLLTDLLPNNHMFEITNYIVSSSSSQSFHIDALVHALSSCIQYDFVILSCGSALPSSAKKLYPIISTLVKKGVIVISALDNSNVLTFPASFDGVIGVVYDKLGDHYEGIKAFSSNVVNADFGVRFSRQQLDYLNQINESPSNSYAVPVVAACIILRMIEHGCKTIRDVTSIAGGNSGRLVLSDSENQISCVVVNVTYADMFPQRDVLDEICSILSNEYGYECLIINGAEHRQGSYSITCTANQLSNMLTRSKCDIAICEDMNSQVEEDENGFFDFTVCIGKNKTVIKADNHSQEIHCAVISPHNCAQKIVEALISMNDAYAT